MEVNSFDLHVLLGTAAVNICPFHRKNAVVQRGNPPP